MASFWQTLVYSKKSCPKKQKSFNRPWVGLGVTNSYQIPIYIQKYAIHFKLYESVYPIGINIFPIGCSLFPIRYSPLAISYNPFLNCKCWFPVCLLELPVSVCWGTWRQVPVAVWHWTDRAGLHQLRRLEYVSGVQERIRGPFARPNGLKSIGNR